MKSLLIFTILVTFALCEVKIPDEYRKAKGISSIKSHAEIEKRIAGGDNSVIGDIPYFALIYMEYSMFVIECGGSLIKYNWVLTAAACLTGVTHLNTYLGIVQRDTQTGDYQNGTSRFAQWESGRIAASNQHLHPDHNSSIFTNDIALLNIPLTEATLSSLNNVAVIKLPTWNDAKKTFAGSTGTISGFGVTGTEFSSYLKTLKNVQIISNDECVKDLPIIIDSHICSKVDLVNGPCSGDEGGALVVTTYDAERVIGIASLAYCTFSAPIGYTRVSSYLEWIATYVGSDLIEGSAPASIKLSFFLSALALVISMIK